MNTFLKWRVQMWDDYFVYWRQENSTITFSIIFLVTTEPELDSNVMYVSFRFLFLRKIISLVRVPRHNYLVAERERITKNYPKIEAEKSGYVKENWSFRQIQKMRMCESFKFGNCWELGWPIDKIRERTIYRSVLRLHPTSHTPVTLVNCHESQSQAKFRYKNKRIWLEESRNSRESLINYFSRICRPCLVLERVLVISFGTCKIASGKNKQHSCFYTRDFTRQESPPISENCVFVLCFVENWSE